MPSETSPLREYFFRTLHWSLTEQMLLNDEEAESYLADMLVRLMSTEGLYGVRDEQGRPVHSVPEMLAYGDVRLKADSFAQEREVHRHVGDFLLFWSGLFPEGLKRVRAPLIDPVDQGRASYAIAGSFDHDPYAHEAPILRRLSERFEEFQEGLRLARRQIGAIG
ncbi:hypothetical protein EON82_02550 [bacterium]|nr:MAG: hypothetical protein EON82_02550 [bacterium]